MHENQLQSVPQVAAPHVDVPAFHVQPAVAQVPDVLKVAQVLGGKSAQMMKVPDAERLTGYRVGGIGPFGQKRKVPTAFDETVELYDRVYINAGQRGLLLSIAPADAVAAADGKVADLIA